MDKDKEFEQKIVKIIQGYNNASAFTDKKLTDTPTDDLQVVNRKFVTMNGTSANRPTTSIIGQFYFDTTLNKPVWWRGDAFVDGSGTVV